MRLIHSNRLQTYRNAKRLWFIGAVFFRCLLAYFMARFHLRRKRGDAAELMSPDVCLGVALRTACEKLGPTFVKFAQVLSTRRDLFPDGVAGELARLQDGVETMPFADVVSIVETGYQRPLKQIFLSFSEKPLGSASLSQVHEARLASTGEAVVVKVQRPGIQKMVDTDIDIIRRLIPLFERCIDEFRHLNLRSIVEEFYKTIRMEMDFTREMHNTMRFKKNFADDPSVNIPSVYKDLCTDKVLVLEKLEGVKIDQIDALVQLGYNRNLLSQQLVSLLAKQVFTHGVYNGDVHAGNIHVMPGQIIGLIDFGMVRTIDPETQRLMTDLFLSVITKDAIGISRILAGYAEPGHVVDTMLLSRDLHELIVFYYDLPEEDICVETLLETVMDLLFTHKLIVPQQLVMLCRAAVMTESLIRMLSPGMCFVTELSPYIKKAIKNRFSFEKLGGEIGKFATDSTRAIRTLPAAFGAFLANLNEGVRPHDFRQTASVADSPQVARMMMCLTMSVISGTIYVGSILLVVFAPAGGVMSVYAGPVGMAVASLLFVVVLCKLIRKE